MSNRIVVTLLGVLLLAGCVSVNLGCISVRGSVVTSVEEGGEHLEEGALRHVVLFKFHDDVAEDQVNAVINEMRRLPDEIGEVEGFEWGTEISGRGMNQGFTHGALFSFDDEADRDAYLAHPVHQDFVALIRPLMAEIFVFDYWAWE
jgi:stress responsive alpha/beta barrel protein